MIPATNTLAATSKIPTKQQLQQNDDALVLHIGCGLDSRCLRVRQAYRNWIDCDFPEVISVRRNYYTETKHYKMMALDATDTEQIKQLPGRDTAIVVLEGVSMYLSNNQLHTFLKVLREKYNHLHILMDIYTEFGAKASKYKNPVNDVEIGRAHV